MRRLGMLLVVLAVLLGSFGACGAGYSAPEPLRADAPEAVVLPTPADDWGNSYLSFMEGSYDIFSALWPEGISGVGFVDLDLDGTPEMVVFDQGASATLGAQIFDLIDGKVYCVSSTLDSAAGAFGGTHLSTAHVCTSFFESFRLSRTDSGWCFWVDSSNSTMETAWDEIVRFGNEDGVLTLESVCYRYLWNDFEHYSASHDGFMMMVKDALAAYVPITGTVSLASSAG